LTTELDYENQNANASMVAEITDEMLDQAQEVQDPTRDINIPLEPPRAGVYKWRWKPNVAKKGGLYFKNTDNNQLLLNVSLLGQLLAEGTPLEGSDFDGFTVADHLNSYQRKGTTSIHHFANCCGSSLPKSFTLKSLKEMTEELLAQEPSSYAMIEWKATINQGGKWKDLAKRMTDFPKLEDGSGHYQPWIETENDEGESVKIYAQAYVVAHVLPSQIHAS
jgi:hypothetical protein